MRPDEHKKKKNAAYKKKHGINKGEGDEGDNKKDSKSKGDKGKSAADKKPEFGKGRDGKSAPSRSSGKREDTKSSDKLEKVQASSDSDSSDSEVETQNKRPTKKTFRRREIVSNWQKYELEPEADEKVTAKGESYKKLLNMAGEAMSHFRFKDELEWEDHSDAGQTDADSYSQMLSLNPSHLAQSLSCLPVHQVLGISQDLFTEEQLISMQQTAKENRSTYDIRTSQQETEYLIDPSREETLNDHEEMSPEVVKKPSIISSAVKTTRQSGSTFGAPDIEPAKPADLNSIPGSEKTPDSGKTTTKTNSMKSVKGAQQNTHDGVANTSQVSGPQLALQDEDLDALLDLDSPAVSKNEKIKVTSSSQVQRKSLSTPQAESSPQVPSTTGNNAKKVADKSAELEDWLDSILDD